LALDLAETDGFGVLDETLVAQRGLGERRLQLHRRVLRRQNAGAGLRIERPDHIAIDAGADLAHAWQGDDRGPLRRRQAKRQHRRLRIGADELDVASGCTDILCLDGLRPAECGDVAVNNRARIRQGGGLGRSLLSDCRSNTQGQKQRQDGAVTDTLHDRSPLGRHCSSLNDTAGDRRR